MIGPRIGAASRPGREASHRFGWIFFRSTKRPNDPTYMVRLSASVLLSCAKDLSAHAKLPRRLLIGKGDNACVASTPSRLPQEA
jgi:hypothetical protein